MVCDGALPINRWVKVSAMWFPMFQLVSIAVFDITLEQQSIGVFPTGPLVDIQVAGGVAGSPFVGTCRTWKSCSFRFRSFSEPSDRP
jgi:hypothetical protein